MSIRTSTRLVDGVVIVDIIGQLKLGPAIGVLRDVVRGVLTDGYRKILLNFADVLNVDSCGVGELMTTYTTIRKEGGDLKLMQLNKHVKNLLHITKLYTLFETYDDQDSAVRSFHQPAPGTGA